MTSIRSPQQLGDALRAARKQLGLAAGVGVRFIVDLEAGKRTLRLENVLRALMPRSSGNGCIKRTSARRWAWCPK